MAKQETISRTDTLRVRDEVLTNLLYHIAKASELNERLILQGGGALHFIYSSPRYSDDLDFACQDFRENTEAIVRDLTGIKELNEEIIYSPNVSKKQANFLRVKYNPLSQGPIVKVEILECDPEEYEKTRSKFSPLLVESPEEIYADKIVASLKRIEERGTLKPTDLFDLEFLAHDLNGQADQDRIERKAKYFKYYGWNKKNVYRAMSQIISPNNHDSYRRNFSRTLMPDVYDNKKFDLEFFEKAAAHFEKLKEI